MIMHLQKAQIIKIFHILYIQYMDMKCDHIKIYHKRNGWIENPDPRSIFIIMRLYYGDTRDEFVYPSDIPHKCDISHFLINRINVSLKTLNKTGNPS